MADGVDFDRRADELALVLRTMRKWGFTVIQDNPGASQVEEEQMQRARLVAADLLGCDSANDRPAIERLATALLQTADAGRQLPQFR